MAETRTVDVVVPYSPEHTPSSKLERALDSVEEQSVPTESIVVEDGPGPAWARNRGLERSEARYVAFLDADDYWTSGKLERQLERISEAEVALCLTRSERSDGSHNTVAAESSSEFARRLFVGEVWNFTSSMLVDTARTDARFDELMYRLEDHLFALEAVADGGYCYVDEALTRIEKLDSGLSTRERTDRKLEAQRTFFDEAIELFPELETHADRYWDRVWYNAGRSYYYQGKYQNSIVCLWKAFRHVPRPKTTAALGLSLANYFVSSVPFVDTRR